MSVVLIGGHDRMHSEYKITSKKLGHQIKIFTQGKGQFGKAIGNPDAMIIFTNTVSHRMVNVAKNEAKKKKIPIVRCHTSSKSALKNVLVSLSD